MRDIHELILGVEKGILLLIALLTVFGVWQEMYAMLVRGEVKLTDLLLLFIYAEVLGMVAAFYRSREVPITIAIFVAITALCRLIILQGKGVSTIDLIYESAAVLLLAISAVAIRWNQSVRQDAAAQIPPHASPSSND
jgi:protein PsiE